MGKLDVATVPAPHKRIALFLDGTWNVDENNTNVWRLYSLCAKSGHDAVQQVSYYTKGVGTSYGETIRGGMFGFGLDEIVKSSYEWLIANYNAGDELFVFGFSRGAYAARTLAGLIARCGILMPGSPIGVGELFARYLMGDGVTSVLRLREEQRQHAVGDLTLLERWMLTYCQPADIRMVGVWDTVAALRGAAGYRETGLRLPIQNVFHALAIDEHRPTFAPTLFTRNTHTDRAPETQSAARSIAAVEQRWFAGAHANVGGGYNSDLLPQVPLRWLMAKASALDLAFRDNIKDDDGVYQSPIADSFRAMGHGAYYLLKLGRAHYRPIGSPKTQAGTVVTETVNETIDASVFERWRRNATYRPQNLLDWSRRHSVDVGTVSGSVSAVDPGVRIEEPAAEPAPTG